MVKNPKHQKISVQLDRILTAELSARFSGLRGKPDAVKACEKIEARNRRIVTSHQQGAIAALLPAIFTGMLELREGGKLHILPGDTDDSRFKPYRHAADRHQTLATAALLALEDQDLARLFFEKRALFDEKYKKLHELKQLSATVQKIKTRAQMMDAEVFTTEEKSISRLTALSPLSADLKTIEARYLDHKNDPYLSDAARSVLAECHAASQIIADKSQKAARLLFDEAAAVFHAFTATPAQLTRIERFVGHLEALTRYEKIFETLGDEERKNRIHGFVVTIDATLTGLRREAEKQKIMETRQAEKQHREADDFYEKFLDIQHQFSQGRIDTETQKKGAGEKLKKYRDGLAASGQRIKARDIERFMNSTGIGKHEEPKASPADFDYQKGFWILLPIAVALLFGMFLMIIF